MAVSVKMCGTDTGNGALLKPNIVGTTETATAGLSRGRLGTVRLKFHCQVPSGEPLVIGRRGWI